MPRPVLHRLGLRRRVVAAFTAGALLLSSLSAVATWVLSAGYMQAQRTRIATAEAAAAAAVLQQGLADGVSVPRLLERVASPQNEALVRSDGQWYGSQLTLTADDVPAGVVAALGRGEAVRQRASTAGGPRLFVGFPLPDQDVVYVAVLPLTELDSTLRALSIVLLGAAALTSLAGVALGVWASRRALTPLVRLNAAAASVAAGDLSVRLPTDDPDLVGLAATFNRTVEDLRTRLERDARFASDVSHELRSPLTTLANAVTVMAGRRDELSDVGRQMLAAMQEEVDRFGRIVRDLLEISLDDSQSVIATEPIRIAELVRAAVGSSAPVTVAEGAEAAVVRGDRRRLERVVCNLLENAAAHAGGAVRVVVDQDGGRVLIAVEDAGPGVPLEHRRLVFERFYRGGSARTDAGGSGLGLALVSRHVRRHRGEVWVEDRPGGGARFVVSLPLLVDPESRSA